jgi:ethanolamine ammonia-lyase small subunit
MTEPKQTDLTNVGWADTEIRLRTQARIALGRYGSGVPTKAAQNFLLDHARAKAAVWSTVDFVKLGAALGMSGLDVVDVASKAANRADYVRRPDLGRQLSEQSRHKLLDIAGRFDLTIIIADGLSANAVEENAVPLTLEFVKGLEHSGLRLSPIVLASGGRVAIGDEIAEALGSTIALVLIGERPGLSASNSLGAYMTYGASIGHPDSGRNCISNIRDGGLSIAAAATALIRLTHEMTAAKASGVRLAPAGHQALLTL